MSDVLHAKFISSYHSSGEEMEVPDLFYRYNQQFLNVYNRKENELISTVSTKDLADIADEKQLVIQYVLEATFRNNPLLVIVTTTIKSTNKYDEPRIYVFWHRVFEDDIKLVHFDLPMVGEISVIAMTSQPVVMLKKSFKEFKKQEHLRHLLAFGKRDQSLQVASLDDDWSNGKRIRGKVIEVKLPSKVPGDITAIHILPQSTIEHRLGYGDPRIFVGTSAGYIQVLRFKARIKKPDISVIHVLEGYTWTDLTRKGVSNIAPITCLISKRAIHSHQVMTVIVQEQKRDTLYDGGDDSAHDDDECDDDINDSKKEYNDNASLRVIEWAGNFSRRILNPLTPSKLTSYTLSSTRIIPTPNNYQVTAIFQSTRDKQHFEVDVWIIEKGVAQLVLADEIFERNIGSTPEDAWPIFETTRYLRLDPASPPIEVDTSGIDVKPTLQTMKLDPSCPPDSEGDTVSTVTTDNTETIDTNDESRNTTADDQNETTAESANGTDILTAPNEIDEREPATSSKVSTENLDNDSDDQNNHIAFTENDDSQSQSANDDNANGDLDYDFSDGGYKEMEWKMADTTARLGDSQDSSYSVNDIPGNSVMTNGDHNADYALEFVDSTNDTSDSNIVANSDSNLESNADRIFEPVVDLQQEQSTMDHPHTTNKTVDSHVTSPSILSIDELHTTTIEEDAPDFQDACDNFDNNNENRHLTMDQEKPTTVLPDSTVISETTKKAHDSGAESSYVNHHYMDNNITHDSHITNDTNYINIDNVTHDNNATNTDNDITQKSHTAETDNDVHSHLNYRGNLATTTTTTGINVDNDIHSDVAEANNVMATTTTIIDNTADDEKLGFENDLSRDDGIPQTSESSLPGDQTCEYTLSSAPISIVSRDEEETMDHLCKLEQNVTGLGSNSTFAAISSETAPSSTAPQVDEFKPVPSEQTIDITAKELESPSPTLIYEAKVKKVARSSLSDGLDMVRNDESTEFNRLERLHVLFDIIFSMATTTTSNADMGSFSTYDSPSPNFFSPNTKMLDINNAMKLLESLPFDATEKDALMNYCFNNENPVLKLFILNYNIHHGNFSLVMMQHDMMSKENSSTNQQSNSSHSTDDVDHSEKTILAIKRTCSNLAKLSQDMVPSILQDLPLEIFGRARGKVGNPFINQENSSTLLQEKGLGLGREALVQVMKSRKRRRLTRL